MTIEPDRAQSTVPTMQSRISKIADSLVAAVRSVVGLLDGPIATPTQLTLVTGLNRNSASKIMMALSKRESLAALYAMPGPEALRKLGRGVLRAGIPKESLKDFDHVLDQYEHLVTHEFDGKPALDGAVALWLPDARARVEAANRHLMHRGISAIRGVSVDMLFTLGFVAPSSTVSDRCDVIVSTGSIGMRRVIPNAPIRLLATKHENAPVRFETIDGAPMVRHPIDGLLPEYCSRPMPGMTETSYDSKTAWAVADDALGFNGSLDVVFASVGIGLAMLNPPSGRRMGQAQTIGHPAREANVDMFLHRDVWQGLRPECVVYDTIIYGNANFNDHSRDIDRVNMQTNLIDLGMGVQNVAISSVPRYRELAADLCGRRGWNPDHFRGYRFRVKYPIYGGQYSLIFTAT